LRNGILNIGLKRRIFITAGKAIAAACGNEMPPNLCPQGQDKSKVLPCRQSAVLCTAAGNATLACGYESQSTFGLNAKNLHSLRFLCEPCGKVKN